MVYDLIYDENGNVENAWIMQSKFFSKNVITKICNTVNIGFGKKHFLFHYSNPNNGVIEGSLNLCKITESGGWKKILVANENNDYSNVEDEYSILRFVHKNENEKAILKYNGTDYNDREHDNEIINLPKQTKARLDYSKLYIEKTVDVHNDDIVEPNDELTYTLTIRNNSEVNYKEKENIDDIIVTEDISEYVTYKNYEVSKEGIVANEDIENGKIEWNIGKLDKGEEIVINYTVKVNEKSNGNTIVSTGTVGNIPSSVVRNKIGCNLTRTQKNAIVQKYNELKDEFNGKELINKIYNEALKVNLGIDTFNIADLIKNGQTSTSANTISLKKNNSFYNQVLNKYWSALYYTSYNDKIIAYDLKTWRGFNSEDRRQDTIYGENFKTGDILIYMNKDDNIYSYKDSKETEIISSPVTYENGEYAYIFIEGKGFVGVNFGNDGEVGTSDDRNEFNAEYYTEKGLKLYSAKETDPNLLEFYNYQTLFGKDYYVILRPSLSVDFVDMNLDVNYSTMNLTNGNVDVTITSNEEMCRVDGWNLSEDKKTLTKTYSENANEEVKIYDYMGNEKTVNIKIENILKELESPKYTISKEDKNISKINVKESIEQFKTKFNVDSTKVHIYTNKSKQTEVQEGIVKTGMVATFEGYDGDYEISVKGDTNGDGELTLTDMMIINNFRLYGITNNFEGVYRLSADVNDDNKIDFFDMVMINNCRLHGTGF